MVNKYVDSLVSVIIPTYNSASYLTKTVKSVLAQTYSDVEVLLIDDCSTDSTQDLILNLATSDDRVKYHFQEKNCGAAVSRNVGINMARGRYIAFLDSDDTWECNKVEKQVGLLREDKPFVYCAYDIVDKDGKQLQGKNIIKSTVCYNDLMTKTYIGTSTVIYDRLFFGNIEMPLRRTGQDYAFWLVLLRKSDAVGIDEPLAHITRRAGSLSKNKLQSLIDVFEVQTQFENINSIKAIFNTVRYLLYAVKKKLVD